LDTRLHEAFEFSSNLAERARVACAVREPSAEQLGFLVRWLEELKPDECPVVMGRLREGLKRTDVDVAGLLRGELPSRGPNLRLWLSLCYLGEEEPVAAVLQPGTDPKPRAALTEGLAEWWPGGALVAETLARTRSPDVRSALCCGLAEFPIGRLTEEEVRLLRGELERQYRDAPDGATHGAAGLALQRLGGTLPVLPTAQRPVEGRDWFVDRFGQTLVRLTAGEFTMGMEPGTFSHAIQSESVAHRVTIPHSFYIAATEVTRGNFEAFLADPHRRLMDQFEYAIWRNKWNLDNDRISPKDRHPIQNVRWRGALLFCDWLSRLDGRRPCYRRFDRARLMPMGGTQFSNIRGFLCDLTADGYRLPTEEEWEYACRAGAATDYSFGDLDDGDNDRVRSKYSHLGGRMTQLVGSLLPNRWGLFDLHGNVCEWCWNGDRVYSSEPYLGEVPRVSGLKIVHRGGSWDLGLRWAMAGYRGPGEPNHDYDHNMGFRVVCGERRVEPVAEEEPGPRGGFVFHDFRGDGQFDDWQEDAPLEGLEVYVDLNRNGVRDADEPTTTSDERGEFDFPGLPAGEYVVRSVPLGPWIVREGATPWRVTPVAPLRAGEVAPGMTSPAVLVVEPDGTRRLPTLAAFTGHFLEGDVFVDRNLNQQRDPGEPGIAGATLTITGPHDDVATFTTGPDGKIRVWRIPGPQQAVVDLPDGYKWVNRAHKSQQAIMYSQPPPALRFPCREVE
jgi:formylglycine-generating enzyme required for sulfatase activity